MEKARERALKVHRRTVCAPDADECVADLFIDLLGPTDVIANEEIQAAVVVVIEPCGSRAPSIRGPAYSSFCGDVAEFATRFIVQKPVPTDSGNENVDASVIVVIAGGGSHPVDRRVEA